MARLVGRRTDVLFLDRCSPTSPSITWTYVGHTHGACNSARAPNACPMTALVLRGNTRRCERARGKSGKSLGRGGGRRFVDVARRGLFFSWICPRLPYHFCLIADFQQMFIASSILEARKMQKSDKDQTGNFSDQT